MDAASIIRKLRAAANPANVEGMARFGIRSTTALGVGMPLLRAIARETGKNHELAQELWSSGILEARILAAFIDEPRRVTARQMDRWARDFENWADCDGVCLHLFVRTPLAHQKVASWCRRRAEFVKRAGFTLLACLTVHDKAAPDEYFIAALPLIEAGATDERNFVKKAVNWALRQIGKRNARLNAEAIRCAERLRAMDSRAARWVAADALRELRRCPAASLRRGAPARRPAAGPKP